MKSIISETLFILFVLIIVSCKETVIVENVTSKSDIRNLKAENISVSSLTKSDDSVSIDFRIEKIDNDLYSIVVDMNLFGDSWIVSPLDISYPYGPMSLTFSKNDNFLLIDSIVENPKSEFMSDPNWEQSYRVIKKEVILSQKIKLLSTKDFQVSGKLFFVLEPICTPNELHFKLTSNSGVLSIKVDE